MKAQQAYKPTKSNLSPAEWKALNALRKDNSIIIIPADKGNKIVVLDRDVYLAKLEQRTSKHIPVKVDPAIAHEQSLNLMLNDFVNSESKIKDKDTFLLRRTDLLNFLIITSEAPSPWNHGLIKLHKDGFPLRDIPDASFSKLAKSILPLFSGYTGQTEHHLSSHS